jgi:lipopolysaccharide/colanic/teichoic acid biosynthesis glycosyltransferase
MILIWLTIGESPFFLQRRPGKNGVIFTIIKFKTMNSQTDSEGNLLSDAERLTKLGKFVRKTSLDEIPQLLNVIKGNMSIVGPRPLLIEYLKLYNDFQKQRHDVKPGITGYAQVNGRNAITWEKKFELDVYYVKNISFALDSKILLKTVKKVIVSEGITDANSVTTSNFTGNEDYETSEDSNATHPDGI